MFTKDLDRLIDYCMPPSFRRLKAPVNVYIETSITTVTMIKKVFPEDVIKVPLMNKNVFLSEF